jgi:hypothetical protein
MLSMKDIAQAFAKRLEETEGRPLLGRPPCKLSCHMRLHAGSRLHPARLSGRVATAGSFSDFRREQAMPVHDG